MYLISTDIKNNTFSTLPLSPPRFVPPPPTVTNTRTSRTARSQRLPRNASNILRDARLQSYKHLRTLGPGDQWGGGMANGGSAKDAVDFAVDVVICFSDVSCNLHPTALLGQRRAPSFFRPEWRYMCAWLRRQVCRGRPGEFIPGGPWAMCTGARVP